MNQTSRTMETDLKDLEFRNKVMEERVRLTQNTKLQTEVEREQNEAKHLYEENENLRQKIDYLNKKLELNEEFKNIDLEELKMIARSNLTVNETISQLISKWENIQGTRQYF